MFLGDNELAKQVFYSQHAGHAKSLMNKLTYECRNRPVFQIWEINKKGIMRDSLWAKSQHSRAHSRERAPKAATKNHTMAAHASVSVVSEVWAQMFYLYCSFIRCPKSSLPQSCVWCYVIWVTYFGHCGNVGHEVV